MDIGYLTSLGLDDEAAAGVIAEIERELREQLSACEAEAATRRLSDKFGYALRSSLQRAGAKNIKAAGAALDYEWDGLDFDEFPTGLPEAIEKLAASDPYLFGRDESSAPEVCYSFVGISPVEESDGEARGDELTYSEYVRLYHGA